MDTDRQDDAPEKVDDDEGGEEAEDEDEEEVPEADPVILVPRLLEHQL